MQIYKENQIKLSEMENIITEKRLRDSHKQNTPNFRFFKDWKYEKKKSERCNEKIYLCSTWVHKNRKKRGYSKFKGIILYNFPALLKNINCQIQEE